MATSNLANVLSDVEEIQLGVIGRRTGRKRTRPVWFALEGGTVYLLPVAGSDTEWYKNVLEQPTITLGAKHGAADVKKYYSKFDVALAVSPRRARVARSPRRRGAKRR